MLNTLFRWGIPTVFLLNIFGCCFAGRQQVGLTVVPPTSTPRPTFTPAPPSSTPSRTPVPTGTATSTPVPPTNTLVPTPTGTPVPPTLTPAPATRIPTKTPTPVPTDTAAPTPDATASRLKYVLAGTERQLNCFEVVVYGTVLDANNRPLAGVTIEAVGIHGTQGRHVGTVGEDGTYTIPLARFSALPHSEWYIAIFEGNEEVSERFHWTATAACQSSDSGDSQVLWVHWKLVE
jgi:hypothetical protein